MTKRSSAPAPQQSGSLYELVLKNLSAEENWERKRLMFRRRVFAALCGLTFLVLFSLMTATLAQNGFTLSKVVMLLSFCVTTPWLIIGFWHAVIGLGLLRFSRTPEQHVYAGTPLKAVIGKEPLKPRQTALLSCIRNEDAPEVVAKLEAMLKELERYDLLPAFSLYVLSDSNDAKHIEEELQYVTGLKSRWASKINVTYRRREKNTGFKAGNVADFCQRWGGRHDYAITLDADSYLSAPALHNMVAKMNANSRLGILQTLVLGLPSPSLFTRVFQWGMRLGMRSYTLGAAWWQGPEGPYWGHNAIIRIKPFIEHCMLPDLPGSGALSGPILSHDQVEAARMAAAGYQIRVWPVEGGSYEENPPHLIEFIRRDLRWCHGNLQYLKLLRAEGFKPLGRLQLALAILMFVGSPAWLLFIAMAITAAATTPVNEAVFNPAYGTPLIIIILGMVFAPKLATQIHLLLSKERKAYGGMTKIVAGILGELVFSILLAPTMAIAHTIFMGQLALGKKACWGGQARQPHGIAWQLAAKKFWPQTLLGFIGTFWMLSLPFAQSWLLVTVVAGPLLAIPFAVWTSRPSFGQLVTKTTLWALPEEFHEPRELAVLKQSHLPLNDDGAQEKGRAAASR